jgi:DNA-binding transcriptional MerR regulator
MQIGEVAERTALSLRTIRYYEEVGLVPPSARTQGGFRLYTEADVERLLLVKRMKPLEFSWTRCATCARSCARSASRACRRTRVSGRSTGCRCTGS